MEIRKRLALSLKPDIDLVVTDLAKLTNQTKTSLINGILTEMLPVLKDTVFAIRKANEGKRDLALSVMNDTLIDAEIKFKNAQLNLEHIGESSGNK